MISLVPPQQYCFMLGACFHQHSSGCRKPKPCHWWLKWQGKFLRVCWGRSIQGQRLLSSRLKAARTEPGHMLYREMRHLTNDVTFHHELSLAISLIPLSLQTRELNSVPVNWQLQTIWYPSYSTRLKLLMALVYNYWALTMCQTLYMTFIILCNSHSSSLIR